MTDRRITVEHGHDKMAMLKNIAGLLQRLSFRDMRDLSKEIADNLKGVDVVPEQVSEALLKVSDKILAEPAADPAKPTFVPRR